jgi:2-polyprenyl-3-methyl-5-hydroxy-6-metoxy-1,4-benzoquinol methylase
MRCIPLAPTSGEPFQYAGGELEVFRHAVNWKEYFGALIRPHLGREVVEVGAGIGGTTAVLCRKRHDRWLCVEPDPGLAGELTKRLAADRAPTACEVTTSVLATLPAGQLFDSVLYIDVLEHIEDDRRELADAAARLRPGGTLIVLSPAHPVLFSPFDAAIGHWRRYTKQSLRAVGPAGCAMVELRYLDAVGMAASLANRLLLKSSMPTERQVRFWDGTLVPVSRMIDRWLAYTAGKSVLGIWRKT